MTTTAATAPPLTRWISPPRFAPYQLEASGNARSALRLYDWNRELSGAVYELLHMFEVVLRNAMDERLCAWNAKQPNANGLGFHSPDWLLDPAPLLIRLTRNGQDIRKAHEHATTSARAWQPSRSVAHSDVLSQLSLGTWRYLLPNKDPGRQRLWNEALRDAFPKLTTSSRLLTAKVHDIHLLRNRVAHLEPLIRTGVVSHRLTDVLDVLRAVDTVPEQWASGQQRVTTVLKARPR
ncbi:Abi-like protein [Promicromonospora umidemergens]|uniref:Abi family protein n=1 Tax=Promicromonospora umidemergens TaxID=629679 RepID=A0ABP8X7L9_9MICO|nr:hypothetical protein [Promicromonospora umidemergens]MCP2281135.1 Abi-like protein [Promicromonospora umidemergens]